MQVPGNKREGQGKGLAAGDEKRKKKTRFQRKDAKNGSPERGWQSQLARKDHGARLCFGEESGASSRPVSRAGDGRRAWDCCLDGGFQSWPHGRPGHHSGPGQCGGSLQRRARLAAGTAGARPGARGRFSTPGRSLLRQKKGAEAGVSAAHKFVFPFLLTRPPAVFLFRT